MNSPRVFGERAWRRLGDIRGAPVPDRAGARLRAAAVRVPPVTAIACALVVWPVWAAACAVGGVDRTALLWALVPLAVTGAAGWSLGNRIPAGQRIDALLGPRALTLTVATVMSVAATDRLVGLASAYDVNPDELTYLNIIGNTLTNGRISFYDSYFFLHPPVFFLLGAGWLGILPHSRDVLDEVHVLRGISALMGAGTAGLSSLIAWDVLRPDRSLSRGTRLGVAALAGGLVAVDPFALRINSLALIDSTAVFFVVAGVAVVLRWGQRSGWGFLHATAAGVLFGAALLTKEMTVFVGLGPIALAACLRWVPWRFALGVCATATWGYLWYPVATYGTGHWGGFEYDKLHGFLRLSGQVQISGFNQAKGPSLIETAARLLVNYAVSYLILGAALPCAIILMRQPWVQQRLAGLWALCAVVLVAFLVVKGTLEEQFFYYLLIPSIVCFTLAGLRVARSDWLRRRFAWGPAVACAVIAVFAMFDVVAYGVVRTRHDAAWSRMVAHVRSTIPVDTPVGIAVGAPDVTSWAYLVNETRLSTSDPPLHYRVTSWPDTETPVRWVIVSSRLVDDGLVDIPPATLRALRARGKVRYTVTGDTYGSLTLYRLPRSLASGKVASG